MAVRKTTSKPKKSTSAKSKPAVVKKSAAKKKPPVRTATKKKTVTTPVLSIPMVTPVVRALPEAAYKEVGGETPNRLKLWLTVGISMTVIVCIWAYALSQSLFTSQALQESSDQLQLDNFVDSVSDDLENLRTKSETLTDQTNTTTPVEQPEEQPSNQEINNLFSDL